MPLRDHFHPPLTDRRSWDGLHGQWPAMIVIGLNRLLPEPYVAEPQIHLGTSVETDLADMDDYSVRVYDTRSGRRLVAAVELVSPSNKDRPEHRRAFVAKCSALLQEHVCVVIVDLVDESPGESLSRPSGASGSGRSRQRSDSTYAVSCRWGRSDAPSLLETWAHPLKLGQPLPTLPLWVSDDSRFP